MKFFAKLNTNMLGCQGYILIEADSEKEANEIAYQEAIQWAEMYVEVIDTSNMDEEEFQQLEDDYEGSYLGGYIALEDVDWHIEPYNSEKHDGYLY